MSFQKEVGPTRPGDFVKVTKSQNLPFFLCQTSSSSKASPSFLGPGQWEHCEPRCQEQAREVESSRQGVLWTSSNSEHETAGIFQAPSAEAVTLANLPLYTEHLAVTQRQIPEVLRRSKGTWKQGAPKPRLYSLLAPAFQSEAAGHWKSRVTKLRIYSCST